VGLLFTILQPKIKEKTGLVPPERIVAYVAAVLDADPAAKALLTAPGSTAEFFA
jgi:hypothetical protein